MTDEIEEKKEFLKREEIRTMQKDIEGLREEEARKERERIAALKLEKEAAPPKKEAEILTPPPTKEEEVLIPRALDRKPSFFDKVFIRVALVIIIILIFALLFTFWYWYFNVFTGVPEKPELKETPPAEEVEEVSLPLPLISVDATKTLEVLETGEISTSLSQFLTEELKENAFTQVLFKNLPEKSFISFPEFLTAFRVKTPENFYPKLEENYTVFIYPQKEGKRMGFIIKIKGGEGLKELLKSWESSLEKDFENFFILMGKEKPALVPYFRDGNYEGVVFRFQTFSKADLGIVYLITDDYFVFTSSWESMKEIIDQLIKL